MSVTTVIEETEVETTSEVVEAFIPKMKGSIDVEVGRIANADYARVFMNGLIPTLSKGLAKITKNTHPDPAKLAAAAREVVEANLQALYDGTYNWGRSAGKAAKTKVPQEVMKIAMDTARAHVKAWLKSKGKKLAAIKTSEITKYAKEAVAKKPKYLEDAFKQFEAQKAEAIDIGNVVDVGEIKEDPALLAAIDAKKKASKAQLSAAQAGRAGRSARH